ncbi:RIP metalloprotease RseP [Bulleidia sp. zg-1006]|uniref:RIP metalloprotease RseP n=1 Tax=Bulleidia sp. zg-1006 TaxID=2806552 RepID=UPI001939CAF4|nr:RIP metalloprotease RseP [Bulleidia sp. zg-1006]QRG87153.1 RIP metalloprotease RseP [Bulleidia sp. zg-1006]
MNLIIFLLVLSFIVAIHEFGHLLAAKAFGVYCYEYAVGMGPQLLKTRNTETTYALRLLPIGGFVAMAGAPEDDENYADVEVPEGRHLSEKKTWQRVIVMLAGVIMNFLLAWLLFSICLVSTGHYQEQPKAIIGEVLGNSAASEAGLQSGDVIQEIVSPSGNHVKPYLFSEMPKFESDKTYTISVLRNGEVKKVTIRPKYDAKQNRYWIGISAKQAPVKKVTLWNMWWYGAVTFGEVSGLMAKVIIQLFQGIGLQSLSGPVGIYQVTSRYASMGLIPLLFLVAQLSLNVGIFNLLPLPVLDGGQIVITLIEGAIHRPLKEKYKLWVMMACWFILIGLMLFVTWNDISRLLFH